MFMFEHQMGAFWWLKIKCVRDDRDITNFCKKMLDRLPVIENHEFELLSDKPYGGIS